MKIIDSYLDIQTLFQNFNLNLWRKYIEKISYGLSEKIENDSRDYDFNEQILPVIQLAMESNKKLDTAHQSFLTATEGLEEKLMKLVGSTMQVDIIFYLGLCNGAGWATELNGNKMILLGVEKIIELDWCDLSVMRGLIYHELGHIWHDTSGNMNPQINSTREKYILQLYQEGFAMYFEQLLADGPNQYHQNQGDWLNWCASNQQELIQEYLRRLRANESARDFFGDWHSYRGYSNIGYYIGCEFIKWLAKTYSLRELANLNLNTLWEGIDLWANASK